MLSQRYATPRNILLRRNVTPTLALYLWRRRRLGALRYLLRHSATILDNIRRLPHRTTAGAGAKSTTSACATRHRHRHL